MLQEQASSRSPLSFQEVVGLAVFGSAMATERSMQEASSVPARDFSTRINIRHLGGPVLVVMSKKLARSQNPANCWGRISAREFEECRPGGAYKYFDRD